MSDLVFKQAKNITECDERLSAVAALVAEFRGWSECDAEQVEGQEEEVAIDHNRMLAALKRIGDLANRKTIWPPRADSAGSEG